MTTLNGTCHSKLHNQIKNVWIENNLSSLPILCQRNWRNPDIVISLQKVLYELGNMYAYTYQQIHIYGVCVDAVWFIPKYVDSFLRRWRIFFFSCYSTKKNDENKVLSFLKLSTQNGQKREKQYNVEANKKSSDVVQFWSKYIARKGKKSEKRQKDRNIPSKCGSFTANHNCLILHFGMKLDLYRIMKSLSQFY